MSQSTLPNRVDIPIEETSNLESIFPSVEAWEEGLKEIESLIPEVSDFQGKLSDGPQTLLDAFTAIEVIYGSKWNWLMDTLGDIFGAFAIAAIMLFL